MSFSREVNEKATVANGHGESKKVSRSAGFSYHVYFYKTFELSDLFALQDHFHALTRPNPQHGLVLEEDNGHDIGARAREIP